MPAALYVNQIQLSAVRRDDDDFAQHLPNPFTFAGQVGVMQIGNSLFAMRARDYTPLTGQFLSAMIPWAWRAATAMSAAMRQTTRLTFRSFWMERCLKFTDDEGDEGVSGSYTPRGFDLIFVDPTDPRAYLYFKLYNLRQRLGLPKDPPKPLVVVLPQVHLKVVTSVLLVIDDSDDPNALVGPAGFGTQQFVTTTQDCRTLSNLKTTAAWRRKTLSSRSNSPRASPGRPSNLARSALARSM